MSYLDLLEFNGLTEEEATLLNPGDVIIDTGIGGC